MAAAPASQLSIVLGTYRTLAKLVRRLPEKQRDGAWSQLREGYRKNANESSPERIAGLVGEAEKKIAFLRIVTPKDMWSNAAGGNDSPEGGPAATKQAGVTRWVYRSSGEKDANGEATPRKTRQVVSNWDGSNLDPCSVKRHKHSLKRAGFVNNQHAKGMF